MSTEVLIRTSGSLHRFAIDARSFTSSSLDLKRNGKTIELFVSTWLKLLSDSPLSSGKPLQTYKRFLSWISSVGLKRAVTDYSSLSHKLVSRHTLMGPLSSIGEWDDSFLNTPVFFEYNRYFKTGDARLLDFLYTFLNFGKKLDYVDESFNTVAFRDWMSIEKRLTDIEFDAIDVAAMQRILRHVLPRFSIEDFRPKFGPGSVQERGIVGRIGKIKCLAYDYIIDRHLFHGHIGMYGMGEDRGLSAGKVMPAQTFSRTGRPDSSRIARLMFVPKNLKVARSICMEPNTLMFFQQGVLREFVRLLRDSKIGRFIRLNDQSYNRGLCEYGSYTGAIDTIDLSAASDSISLDLVKRIFPPSWLIPMLSTRSHSCYLPNGDIHHLKKFAPMGSALCFPTQCIIFASVCVYAAALRRYDLTPCTMTFLEYLDKNIQKVLDSFQHLPGYSKSTLEPLGVYGDDICLDTRLTDVVKTILVRLGLVVNDDKSFVGGQAFRESCGGFFLSGHDITPLYFRVKGVRKHASPAHVASQVHLINELYRHRYVNTYRFLLRSIMKWGTRKRNPIPFVTDPEAFGILVSSSPANSHLRRRYNEDFQRDEVRGWTIVPTRRRDPGFLFYQVEHYEYVRWWSSRNAEHLTDSKPVQRFDTGRPGLGWRWTPSW